MPVSFDKFKRESISLIVAVGAGKPAFENFVDILQVLLNIMLDIVGDSFKVTLFTDQITDWQSRMSDPVCLIEQFNLSYQEKCAGRQGESSLCPLIPDL